MYFSFSYKETMEDDLDGRNFDDDFDPSDGDDFDEVWFDAEEGDADEEEEVAAEEAPPPATTEAPLETRRTTQKIHHRHQHRKNATPHSRCWCGWVPLLLRLRRSMRLTENRWHTNSTRAPTFPVKKLKK